MTEKDAINKCYRVWFRDGSAVLIDAPKPEAALHEAEQGVKDGRFHGKVARIESLSD